MRNKILLAAFALLLCASASADEGMWMVNAIDKAIHANMRARGLKLKANEIYNADAPGTAISDAVVSLDFGCSGSIVSHESLVITNHHCAYDDVHALSTPEKNYLEDGFWASCKEEEIPIPGKKMQILKSVLDVTDEVNEMLDKDGLRGRMFALRTVDARLEKKYGGPGLLTGLASMWSGSKYYLAIYKQYSDIRLVSAPPVSIAAYGGDIDNWEWPQHKCDFAIYRIYTAPDGSDAAYSAQNVPLKSSKKIDITTAGIKEGDYAMVIGFPGITHRYNSSAKTNFELYTKLPIETSVRSEIMDIMQKWMNQDPVVRLKYADTFFSLSNVNELYQGEILCYKRFGVIDEQKGKEAELSKWIQEDPERTKQWGKLLSELDDAYEAQRPAQEQLEYFRESIIRGSQLYNFATRTNSLKGKSGKPEQIKEYFKKTCPNLDFRLEKDLVWNSAKVFYSNVCKDNWSAFHKGLYEQFDGNIDAICNDIWTESWLSSPEGVQSFIDCEGPYNQFLEDKLFKFFTESQFINFNKAVQDSWTGTKISTLDKEYIHALYQMREDKGIAQYPDANSTERVTYGTVGGFSPKDGIYYDWKSKPCGILEKYNPEVYEFTLKPEWKTLLETQAPDCYVDFITDNDITGGNSGSPVLNAKGQLIGLAYDGNKESLAGDVSFTNGYNKCVCVDIRFVLWTLDKFAGQQWLLDEMSR